MQTKLQESHGAVAASGDNNGCNQPATWALLEKIINQGNDNDNGDGNGNNNSNTR